MADRLMRAQVTIPLDNGVPEDSIVNTFYFDQDDNGLLPPPETSYEAVVTSLAQFYGAFDGVLFPSSVAPEANVKIYDMRDPEPRIVRHIDTITLTPTASAPLPNEVCVCLSFKASPLAGVNPARRRGRVFLGPVSVDAMVLDNAQERVHPSALAALVTAGGSLVTPNDVGGSSLSWAIYSPTTQAGGANIDDSFHDVQEGWIDNAFDTQRRRGAVATARSTFS